ncbi:hypothetical protein DFP73DRAFT_614649 [Morchella snyderi]|nr:hypothetical protein DFP73DRAFT_614649 [Morchella snyderi]
MFETNDHDTLYQPPSSMESSPGSPAHTVIDDMPPAVGDVEVDWFNIVNKSLALQDGPDGISHPAPKGEENWFLTSGTYNTSATRFQNGYPTPNPSTSVFDKAILSTRNGCSNRFMTTFSDLTSILARMGVSGPRHLVGGNLDRVGTVIGKGAQFTVFVHGTDNSRVLKRVNPYNAQASLSKPEQIRTYFRTLELEILALCHPPLREHRNIVDLLEWCYDHQTPEILLPVLVVERAKGSLSEFMQEGTTASESENREVNIRHHFCLDIADGLEALHKEGIVHGDLKPDNVLVFPQNNPRVPYLCKLSDFGVCILIESRSSLSFTSYRGTPGWVPPEVYVYDENVHGDFSPELLFRCDGFSYCLVVISILLTRGRLPFGIGSEEDEESPYEKAIGLIWGLEDRRFPRSLRSRLLSLCGAMLKLKPQDRADVSHTLLADDSKAYKDWIVSREAVRKRKWRHIDGRRTNESNKGITYWMGFQPSALKQLEQDFQDTKNNIGPRFSNETLFGMAISISSLRTPGFVQRVVEYMTEAAKGSCIPAQAIAKRICEAQGVSISTIVDKQILEAWLYNATSTGSFIAAEDLAELNPGLLIEAQRAFRKAGGYNAEASHEVAHPFSGLNIGMARLACESGVSYLQDLNGNMILHFAAMFDKPEVIKYLVEERAASVDCQNDKGETPLHKACRAGHHAAVEMLISFGADASILSTEFKVSPLHWLFIFEKDHIDNIAQLLVLKSGADIGAIVSGEKISGKEQHMPFVHFPFHWPFGTPLHWAASTRSTTAIDSLLKLGADIDSRDSETDLAAQSALDMAARRGDSKIVRHLLSKGASAIAVSGQGHNPLHLMGLHYQESNRLYRCWEGLDAWIYSGTYENHLTKVRECISVLCRAGCDLNRRKSGLGSRPGYTPLLQATSSENCVVALALLDAGASANCKSSGHLLPVHMWASVDPKRLAYQQGFPVLFRHLLDCLDDINAKGGYLDETLVHYATRAPLSVVKSEFEDRIRLLVTHDPPADINAFDKQGSNPLVSAISTVAPGGPVERSEILLHYGARIYYKAGDRDFIFILCYNGIATDGETIYLLRRLLENYSDAEKLKMVASSVTLLFGSEVSAIDAAIKLGKFECVKYFLELGVDPNEISGYRRTLLDWALKCGEQIRRWYLETLNDYFTLSERDAASERGVAFGPMFRNDGTRSGDEGISRENYFGLIKIIAHLVSINTQQARDLIEDGYEPTNPDKWDKEFTTLTHGWFTVETQPFFEHWRLLYSLQHS